MFKIWTFRQKHIDQVEDELRRWKEEEIGWCSVKKDITRLRDSCDRHERNNIGDIMIATCNSCIHWKGEKYA